MDRRWVYELRIARDRDSGEHHRRRHIDEQQAATSCIDSTFLSGEEHGRRDSSVAAARDVEGGRQLQFRG